MEKGIIFNLDEATGDWFDFFESRIDIKTGDVTYDDPKSNTGRICIRSMAPFWRERQRNKKKRHDFVLNKRTRGMVRVESEEDQTSEEDAQEREDAFDYAIVDLVDFFDDKGKSIKCTKENKIKLIAIPVFDRFVAHCFELQQNASTLQAELMEKNSSTP